MIKNFLRKYWLDLLLIASVIVIKASLFDWNRIPSESMTPTLQVHDQVTINKMAYTLRVPLTNINLTDIKSPKRGDVVTFHSEEINALAIKRVIGVAGDTVTQVNNEIYVNGEELVKEKVSEDDNYVYYHESIDGRTYNVRHIKKYISSPRKSYGTWRIPEGHIFVMGDNRDNSLDSRFSKNPYIPHNHLRGRAIEVLLNIKLTDPLSPSRFREGLFTNN